MTVSHASSPLTAKQVLSSKGQAAEKGVVAGDVIYMIGDTLMEKGTNKAAVSASRNVTILPW